MFLRINLITNWGKFCTCCCLGENFALVPKSKSFRDGKSVKQCAIKMAHVFGEDKVARKLETVSLSHQTTARRISDLGKHISSKLKSIAENCIYFSLALDESTDISDTSELLIFIRTVDKNFTVQEELVQAVP